VVTGEGFWTGSSTLPHLHQFLVLAPLLSFPRNFGRFGHTFDESTRGQTSDESQR
jgi:hypothetical protein